MTSLHGRHLVGHESDWGLVHVCNAERIGSHVSLWCWSLVQHVWTLLLARRPPDKHPTLNL
jgi:hypothetical protein